MRKLIFSLFYPVFLLTANTLVAQCFVTISTHTSTTELNCTNTSLTLSANANATGPVTYLWEKNNQQINQDHFLVVNDPGTYSITITGAGGCFAKSSITITKDITIPNVSIQAFPKEICRGGSATLVGLGGQTYAWEPSVSLSSSFVTVNPTTNTTYTVTGTAINGCTASASFELVVNPLPDAEITGTNTICAFRQDLNPKYPNLTFSGSLGRPPYAFKFMDNMTGGELSIKTSPNSNTVNFEVVTGTTGDNKYSLISVTDANNCITDLVNKTHIFKIFELPSNPQFTSLNIKRNNETLEVCKGSENINFNVNSPNSTYKYIWDIPETGNLSLKAKDIQIKEINSPNTVISFPKEGTGRVRVITTDQNNCQSGLSQNITVKSVSDTIVERRIFLKGPGNLLIYPDNTVSNYRWGADQVLNVSPDTTYGAPVFLPNQLYQVYPAGESFDEKQFLYWVLLEKEGECKTRVYFNGPYIKPLQSQFVGFNQPVELQAFPNPNQGNFDVSLKGNIYGNIQAKIYSAAGQQVYTKKFVKSAPEIFEKFNTGKLSSGVYFLELNSSDLKKVVTRIIIQH